MDGTLVCMLFRLKYLTTRSGKNLIDLMALPTTSAHLSTTVSSAAPFHRRVIRFLRPRLAVVMPALRRPIRSSSFGSSVCTASLRTSADTASRSDTDRNAPKPCAGACSWVSTSPARMTPQGRVALGQMRCTTILLVRHAILRRHSQQDCCQAHHNSLTLTCAPAWQPWPVMDAEEVRLCTPSIWIAIAGVDAQEGAVRLTKRFADGSKCFLSPAIHHTQQTRTQG